MSGEMERLAERLSPAQRAAVLEYDRPTVIPTFLIQEGVFKECGYCGGLHRTPFGIALASTLRTRATQGDDK